MELNNTTYWNHRVIKHTEKDGIVWYGVHEVYYTNDKPVACTQEAMNPYGETAEELKEDLERMLRACEKPILDYDTDFPST